MEKFPDGLKIALVHDWLTGMRGGERVLEGICELFPRAELFTLLHIKGEVSPVIEDRKIHTSFVQRLPLAKTYYRHYLPLFPTAIERFDLMDFDLVISSSHCVAKGVITSPYSCHISYVHTPMRYVWEMYHQYFGENRLGRLGRLLIPYFANYLRMWDVVSSKRVDYFIANSKNVAERIEKHYGRHSRVIYPPVDGGRFKAGKDEGFYLVVSAFAPYKRIDLAVEAFNRLGLPLKIAGSGQDYKEIKRSCKPNVELLGWVSDEEVTELFSRARALIFPQEEDFGITPVEAQASGKPVIAYGKGGVLETIDGVWFSNDMQESEIRWQAKPLGVLFKKQTVDELEGAVRFFEGHKDRFLSEYAVENAKRFSKENFKKELFEFCKRCYEEFAEQGPPIG